MSRHFRFVDVLVRDNTYYELSDVIFFSMDSILFEKYLLINLKFQDWIFGTRTIFFCRFTYFFLMEIIYF